RPCRARSRYHHQYCVRTAVHCGRFFAVHAACDQSRRIADRLQAPRLAKNFGRRMADDGCTAHQIMAVLGHTTLAEAERYTREADRRRGGHEGIAKLKSRTNSQTSPDSLGKFQKEKEKL